MPARVRVVDQRAQVLVGAQVRVDLGEVGDPVAVVAGGGPSCGCTALFLKLGVSQIAVVPSPLM